MFPDLRWNKNYYRKESLWLHLWMTFWRLGGWHIFWNTIPILWADLLDPQNLLFALSNNCFQKTKPDPLPPKPDQNPQTLSRPVNGWSLDFCASTWQSDIFIAKRRLEKMQNKIAKLQKEEKGGRKKKTKTKGPLPFAYWVQRHNMQHPAANGKLH